MGSTEWQPAEGAFGQILRVEAIKGSLGKLSGRLILDG